MHIELDGAVHHLVLRGIVEEGRPWGTSRMARTLDREPVEIERALQRLHEGHGLVLHPGSHEVWIAHPFSLVPTAFYVEAHGRGYWAPCAWCALGVVELVGEPARIHTRLGGEGVPLAIECAGEPRPDGLVVHFPVPVARAWDNVHRFCGSTLVFEGEASVDPWCARHGIARGDVRSLAAVRELARRWYGRHLAQDWRKWTLDEARGIFAQVGLSGPTWELPGGDGAY